MNRCSATASIISGRGFHLRVSGVQSSSPGDPAELHDIYLYVDYSDTRTILKCNDTCIGMLLAVSRSNNLMRRWMPTEEELRRVDRDLKIPWKHMKLAQDPLQHNAAEAI